MIIGSNYADVLRNRHQTDESPDFLRLSIYGKYASIVELIVSSECYTGDEKIVELHRLNEARKEVLADE